MTLPQGRAEVFREMLRRVSCLAALLPLAAFAQAMVKVPAGHFTMGRGVGLHDDQKPAHEVTLRAFELDATLERPA